MDRCQHREIKAISTVCFTGPVSRDENPMAHGGVTDTEECVACGARRRVNVNGRHCELGTWGPTRAERSQAVSRARARVAQVVMPYRVTRPDGAALDLSVDQDGMIVVDVVAGDVTEASRAQAVARWETGVSAARALRLALQDA